MKMFDGLISYFFGCRHKHYSWPITVDNTTYVVCSECGDKFSYDWEHMKRGARVAVVVEIPQP